MNRLFTLALGLGLALAAPASAGEASRTGTLYKNPQCGCCDAYADHLRDNGFTVTVEPTHDLGAIGREAGIPEDFQGCHTMLIDGYAVSGHVPLAALNRLLAERPAIAGISLPGMPTGSPGMGGPKTGPFTVYQFPDGGAPTVYTVE